MTREELIFEAAKESVHRQYNCKGEYPCTKHMYCEMCEGHNTPYDCCECGAGDFKEGFLAGAQWADQHPVNPWHDASKELPKKDGRYLIKEYDGYLCALSFVDGDWKTFGLQRDIKYWMPIPEIEKED